jgi:hypothetical protein
MDVCRARAATRNAVAEAREVKDGQILPHCSEQHRGHPNGMDYDDALSGDFDAHALEISPGPQSSALSLAKEAVQLGEMVSA